jgi:hypothetical protein
MAARWVPGRRRAPACRHPGRGWQRPAEGGVEAARADVIEDADPATRSRSGGEPLLEQRGNDVGLVDVVVPG